MEKWMIGTMFLCMILTALCFAHAIVFGIMGEKCIWLVRSYQQLSKTEREKYSKEKICKAGRNILAMGGVWFLLGTAACYFLSPYAIVLFLIVWIAVLVPRMKFQEKRYEKYKK